MSVASFDKVVVKFQRFELNQRLTKAQSNLGYEINVNYKINNIKEEYLWKKKKKQN
jgi:hypothetical protein